MLSNFPEPVQAGLKIAQLLEVWLRADCSEYCVEMDGKLRATDPDSLCMMR
jgi:hypothetical protein